jgi:conjugative relaxase-like TrwC/TraI family protein
MLGGAGGGSGGQLTGYYRDGAACGPQPELEQLPTPGLDVPGLGEGPEQPHADALGYYAHGEVAGARWVGDGARALGLTGPVDAAALSRFAGLLDGQLDGERVARPVLRDNPAGRLPAAELLHALEEQAGRRGIPVEDLLADATARATFAGLQRRVGQGRDWVHPTIAAELSTTAGLDPHALYRTKDGVDRYADATAAAQVRVNVRRIGLDVTVSAPKSVSVLDGLSTDPKVSEAVRRCHDLAVEEALGYLQRHAGHAFRGHHGDGQQMSTIGTDGWIGAAFTHQTSRADDPQLHTHLVIANVVHGQDGRWSAVDSRAVFRHAKTAGYLYQATLRHHLTAELGVSWTDPVKGVAEILGIPREVLREFSTRRRDILTALHGDKAPEVATTQVMTAGSAARMGARVMTRGRRRAAQAACLATRPGKTHRRPEDLRGWWRDRAHQHGLNPRAPVLTDRTPGRAFGRIRRPPNPPLPKLPSWELLADRLFGPDGLTAKRTDFDARDVVQALCELLPPEATGDAEQLEALAQQLLLHPDAVALEPDPDRGAVFSSRDLLRTEQHALTLAATGTRTPTADRALLAAAFAAQDGATGGLNAEQHRAVVQLTVDPRLATVLVGPAGSGKTATLATLHRYWRSQGRPVLGTALAALTAQRLQHDSGIPASSLAALLHRLDSPDPVTGQREQLPPGAMVVLDEAGMVGTRQLTRLLEHTHRAGGQVLLVGDPAQLGEIDAGGLFRHLAQPSARPAELTGNQRQAAAWERQALLDLRHGHTQRAVTAYAAQGRIISDPDPDQLLQRMAGDYLRSPDRYQTIVLATRRDDVDSLNQLIRQRLQADGQLPADQITLQAPDGTTLHVAVGEQLLNTRNLRTAGGQRLLNGTRLRLIAADQRQVTVDDGSRRHVLDTTTAAGSLRHGYAYTIHKAQGLTVDHSLVLADDLNSNAAYTALSRGRQTNVLYRTGEPDTEQLVRQLRIPTGDQLALTRLPAARARDRTLGIDHPLPPTRDRSLGLER